MRRMRVPGSVLSGRWSPFAAMVAGVVLASALGIAHLAAAQGTPPPAPPAGTPAPPSAAAPIAVRPDTALVPELDAARAADAEIRVALFELMNNRPAAALDRLRVITAPPGSVGGTGTWRGDQDRRFLMAESFYRLGMDDSMRVAAQAVLAGPGAARFGAVLRTQLLFAAYRSGDLAQAYTIAKAASRDDRSPLSALLAGLVAYQNGDTALARTSFASAQQLATSGGPYADYARYMSALTAARSDTAHPTTALHAFEAAVTTANGEALNQLTVAGAQSAVEAGQYDRAAASAAAVEASSGSDAEARATRAWALTRGGHPDQAATVFNDLADRYPQLPGREDNRLMAAQSTLEQNKPTESQGEFLSAVDSASTEAQRIAQWSATPNAAARALVSARAADVLLLPDVVLGKTLAFPDSAGGGTDALRAVVSDAPTAAPPAFAPPSLVTINSLTSRVDSAAAGAPGGGLSLVDRDVLRRAAFTREPAGPAGADARADLIRDVNELHNADISVVLANEDIRAQRGNVALQLLLLRRARQQIELAGDSLGPMFTRMSAAEDSLARITQHVDVAGVLLHRLFAPQFSDMRKLSSDNIRQIDSVRRSMGAYAAPGDLAVLDREAATAADYGRIADMIERGLNQVIANHPAFALRDSIRLRGERTRQLIVQTQRAVTTGEAAVDEQMARVSEGGSSTRASLRSTLNAAAAAQEQAVGVLTAAVEHDLTVRAGVLAADARRDQEAAEFGAAGASFFRQLASADAVSGGTAAGDPAPNADSAVAQLERVIQRYPNSPARAGALYELGELLVRRADERYAATQRVGTGSDTSRAARADAGPNHPDYTTAIARYEELIKQYPAFPQIDGAEYTLGTLYASGERYADAAAIFEKVSGIESSTMRAEAMFRLGDARFELASAARGEQRLAAFGKAAGAYEQAAGIAPVTGDIYFLSLYKLGWSYYNQGTQQSQDGYRKAVEVFGRLVDAYDKLPADRQARLGLRDETLDYMAVSFTQVGGAEAANRFFATRSDTAYKIQVLRRVASRLRDQGDFGRAVQAYQELLVEAPNDSSALGVQQEVIDIYQNRTLEPEKAQAARLALVDKFAPGFAWSAANLPLEKQAASAREDALRQSAQYELAKAQGSGTRVVVATRTRRAPGTPAPSIGTPSAAQRPHYAEAARLYGKYMQDYGGADSARAVDTYYAEALFGAGDYAQAGAEYVRSAYGYPGDTSKVAAVSEQQSAQNAIVAYDSALNANKNDRTVQDSLFSAVNQFADHYPHTEIAKRALIEEGRRASEAGRWDVMVSAFRQYSAQWPSDPYTPTAAKLVGDALYKQGKYGDAQAQWDTAYTIAERAGRHTLADSLKRVQASAASIYADSLVKAGQYQRAAEEVYVAYADENPTSVKAADALRNAIETYMLADSVARRKGNDSASKDARTHAADLSNRLITQFPQYQYRLQYQTLHADLLAGLGRGDESIDALRKLIADNPTWAGRADAEIRLATRLDSLGKKKEAAAEYEQFSSDYPGDKRATDAEYNSAVTYLESGDTLTAAKTYATFARRYPADPRAAQARSYRIALLRQAGDSAAANADLAVLCTANAPADLKAECAARAGEAAFSAGVAQFLKYRPVKLVIASRGQLTAAGVKRASANKQQLLTALTKDFTRAIEAGDPQYLAAATYYIGVAQWEYGNFLKDVQLPASLSDAERLAAADGAAKQAEAYYSQAQKTWQALVDKAAQEKIVNKWVDMAKDGVQGKVPDDL
jgi:tetratricopeptide (TPR) repeat protein